MYRPNRTDAKTGEASTRKAHTSQGTKSALDAEAADTETRMTMRRNASIRVDGNGKQRPPFPFPRRKRPFPCGNGTA
eukprot:69229-Chlamydomonas_euryale.AAC.1